MPTNRKPELGHTAFVIAVVGVLLWNAAMVVINDGFWRGFSTYATIASVALLLVVEFARWRGRQLDRKIMRGYAAHMSEQNRILREGLRGSEERAQAIADRYRQPPLPSWRDYTGGPNRPTGHEDRT